MQTFGSRSSNARFLSLSSSFRMVKSRTRSTIGWGSSAATVGAVKPAGRDWVFDRDGVVDGSGYGGSSAAGGRYEAVEHRVVVVRFWCWMCVSF